MKTRQQEERSHEIKVGLTFLVGILVIIYIIFAVGRHQGVLEKRYLLHFYVTRVNGLQTGAPVRLNGVRVGSVVGISFIEEVGNPKIKVSVEILRSVQKHIRKDSEAYIGTLGLLGDKFVSITAGSPDQPMLNDGDFLVGMDPIDVEKLIDESVAAFNELKDMTIKIKEITDKINEGQGTLGLLLNDPRLYNELMSSFELFTVLKNDLESSDGILAKILRDSTMYDELYTFLKNVNILADSLVNGSGSAARFVASSEAHDKLVANLEQISQILQKIEKGEGTVSRMLNDDALYERLVKVINQLDSLATDLKQNPRRYVTVKVF
ncbi:MAG: MlaD family protein [candidate division KSB1 bacterium]|nr:MlaD family protein [candidate division KSB1 bacterium]MDZ7345698.1 MlaD family protein [candidate division KSB1 bacterium]